VNRREFLAVSAGTVAASTAGCIGGSDRTLPDAPAGDWTHHAHDPRNTGAADVTVPPRGTPAWDRGDAGVATPLVDDGTVFSVAANATALDAETGERLWDVELPGEAERTPALDDDRLVVATDRRLLALARADGTERWSVELPRPARGAVTVAADGSIVTVPLAARRGAPGLVAYDAGTGDRLWDEATLSARATAVTDGTVYTTGYGEDGDTGVVRGLSATDGTRLWETALDAPDTPPVVADAGVLVGDGGTLAVHDPSDGTRRGSLGSFGDRIVAPPAVADGTAFVASGDGALVAVSVADGETLWRRETGVVVDTGVGVGRGAVVASVTNLQGDDLAGVAAFERSDGAVRWEHGIEGFDAYPSTPPALADGAVFYASNESSGVVALGDLPPSDEG
jgi:outer membrane protein assembly factor BamB